MLYVKENEPADCALAAASRAAMLEEASSRFSAVGGGGARFAEVGASKDTGAESALLEEGAGALPVASEVFCRSIESLKIAFSFSARSSSRRIYNLSRYAAVSVAEGEGGAAAVA